MYSSPIVWVLLILAAALLFFLPTIIAVIRDSEDKGLVVMLNIFGVTLPVFGWIAAMGFAIFSLSRRPPRHMRRTHYPAVPPPRDYDPGPFRGTPFEAAARRGLWAEHESGPPRFSR